MAGLAPDVAAVATIVFRAPGAGPEPSAGWELLAQTNVIGADSNASLIDTTGAGVLIVGISAGNATGVVSYDTYGNTWNVAATGGTSRLLYCASPTGGPGHRVTLSNASYPSFQFAAFSGAAVLDQASGQAGQPGPLTPSQAKALILTAVSGDDYATITAISGGFAIVNKLDWGNGYNASGLAWLVQDELAQVNPVWTSSRPVRGSTIASFKGA